MSALRQNNEVLWGEEIGWHSVPAQEQLYLLHVGAERRAKARLEQKYRLAQQRRLRKRISIIAIVTMVLLASIFAWLLFEQSHLNNLNQENGQLERKIRQLTITNQQKAVELKQETDMDWIRRRAKELGFREPRREQIVHVNLPGEDRLNLQEGKEALGESETPQP